MQGSGGMNAGNQNSPFQLHLAILQVWFEEIVAVYWEVIIALINVKL